MSRDGALLQPSFPPVEKLSRNTERLDVRPMICHGLRGVRRECLSRSDIRTGGKESHGTPAERKYTHPRAVLKCGSGCTTAGHPPACGSPPAEKCHGFYLLGGGDLPVLGMYSGERCFFSPACRNRHKEGSRKKQQALREWQRLEWNTQRFSDFHESAAFFERF